MRGEEKMEFHTIVRKYVVAAYKDQIVYENLTKAELDRRFQKTLSCLKPKHREIIIKSYVNDNKYWWDPIYPKSTYYFYRNRAIRAFLSVFNYIE